MNTMSYGVVNSGIASGSSQIEATNPTGTTANAYGPPTLSKTYGSSHPDGGSANQEATAGGGVNAAGVYGRQNSD